MPDGSIVLMGGLDGIFKNDVWRLMPAGSLAQNPSHTYTAPGIYQVAMQAYNTNGYNSTRKTGYITVNAPPYIDVSVTGSINDWIFSTGTNEDTTSVDLTIDTNMNDWSVTAKDALDDRKPEGTEGNMTEWSNKGSSNQSIGGSYVPVPPGKVLLNAVKVNYGGGTYITLSGDDQVIKSGTFPGWTSGDLGIKQEIAPTDPALSGSNRYRIVVTFTGSPA